MRERGSSALRDGARGVRYAARRKKVRWTRAPRGCDQAQVDRLEAALVRTWLANGDFALVEKDEVEKGSGMGMSRVRVYLPRVCEGKTI